MALLPSRVMRVPSDDFFAVVGALLFLIATITFITLPAIFIVDTDIDYFGNNHCLRVHNILGRILVLCPSSSRVI